MTVGEAKTVINLYKNGSSINSIVHYTGYSKEVVEDIISHIK